jgi:hypothetical protein
MYSMLDTCCFMMFDSLADKTPFRGAITIGDGGVLKDDSFYGPALAEAHDLESKIAGYPRVLVSNKVRQFLSDESTYSDDPEIDKAMQSLANTCRSLICQDADGHWIVDFLGKGSAGIFRSTRDCVNIIKMAYDFVGEQVEQFSQSGNAKLAGRYCVLKKYIESRLPLWGITASD